MLIKKLKKRVYITLIMGLTLNLLTGCEKTNENLEDTLIESELSEKEIKLNNAISNYVEGENPLIIDGLIVVNKEFGIPDDYATELDAELLSQFELMQSAAKMDGLELSIRSGYRTRETQEMLFNNYVARDGIDEAKRYSAVPGFSEHQSGLAIDISNGDTEKSIGDWFTETPQATWLYENAWKFGFILRYPEGKEDITGYKYESWHYRYVGAEHSVNFNQNNLTLEEYLGLYSLENDVETNIDANN